MQKYRIFEYTSEFSQNLIIHQKFESFNVKFRKIEYKTRKNFRKNRKITIFVTAEIFEIFRLHFRRKIFQKPSKTPITFFARMMA